MLHMRQSPTEPDFVQNPYPFYARMRGGGDLVFWDDYAMPCATTHAAVSAILRDRRFGREVPAELRRPTPPHLAPFYAIEAHSMLELEPPRHTRLRGLVLRAFTSARIKALAPEITALTDALIDKLPVGGAHGQEADLLTGFCQPLPVVVICRLLGVPESHSDQLLTWSNAMVAMYQARRDRAIEDAAARAASDFSAFLREVIDHRRRTPADDLLSELIAAEEQGDKLSPDELIATVVLLLNAGHEATVHTMGNGIKALLSQGLRPQPGGAEALIEEVLRYDPPLHMFTRYAYEDATLFGHDFRRGDQVALLLASANRDATIWDRADQFDPSRAPRPNSSFGAGLHFCVGAPLARLELQIALPILFERLPSLALSHKPHYANSYHFHGLERLLVTA